MKTRLDKLLVERGLAASRERAQALILAGRVLVAEQRVDKPGTPIPEDAILRLTGDDLRYVSRGGLKLEHALKTWKLDVTGLACADIGASQPRNIQLPGLERVFQLQSPAALPTACCKAVPLRC